MKKLATCLVLALMLLALAAVCIADDNAITWENPTTYSSGVSISSTTASISKASSSSVTIKASTSANMTCNMVGGIATIQQWTGSAWVSYKTYSFYGYDRSSYSLSKTVSVASGYSYRLVVTHRAEEGTDESVVRSQTTSVKVE